MEPASTELGGGVRKDHVYMRDEAPVLAEEVLEANVPDSANFASTPYPDIVISQAAEGGKSFDFANVVGPSVSRHSGCLKKLSIGGISHIPPDTPRINVMLKEAAVTAEGSVTSSQSLDSYMFGLCREPRGYGSAYLSTGLQTANLTTHTAGETVPLRNTLTLTCHNIRLEVHQQQGRFTYLKSKVFGEAARAPTAFSRFHDRPSKKIVLNGISAYFPPGMNAIMGPSGSGKTSLMAVLSLRERMYAGDVRINGSSAPKRFSELCGYSVQDDILNPTLSVREHIWYSLCLRRGSITRNSERNELVDEILSSLQLQNCSEEKVGEPSSSRLSGGERKRTSIGMELAAAPKVLFLDEPTSSLDSSMSKSIIRILRRLADKGRTIVLTIHQPSYAIYREMDSLTLLAKGRLVYHGGSELAAEHFATLGFPREPHHSPPDFLLDVLYGNVTSQRRRQSRKSTPHPRRFNSVKESDRSPAYMSVLDDRPAASYDLRGRLLRQGAFSFETQPGPSRSEGRGPNSVPKIMITRASDESYGENNNLEKSTVHSQTPSDLCFTSMTSHISVVNTGEAYASKLDATTCEGMREHSELATWLASAYACSDLGREMSLQLSELENRSTISDDLQLEVNTRDAYRRTSFGLEFLLLVRRALKGSARLCVVLVIMNIIIGLLFGALYYHPHRDRPPMVQNRLGMFFYLAVHGLMVPSMITAKSFVVAEKALFQHERKSGYYRAISYCASRFVVLVIARMLSAITLSLAVYWLAGLNPTGTAFLLFMATCFSSGIACDSLCLLSALGCRSFEAGRSLVILYMSLTSVFAGFLLNLDTAFPWLAWIKYISITRYCYMSWVVGEFSGSVLKPCRHVAETRMQNDDGIGTQSEYASPVSDCDHDLADDLLGRAFGEDDFMIRYSWVNHLVLLLMSLGCFLLCYMRMRKID